MPALLVITAAHLDRAGLLRPGVTRSVRRFRSELRLEGGIQEIQVVVQGRLHPAAELIDDCLRLPRLDRIESASCDRCGWDLLDLVPGLYIGDAPVEVRVEFEGAVEVGQASA